MEKESPTMVNCLPFVVLLRLDERKCSCYSFVATSKPAGPRTVILLRMIIYSAWASSPFFVSACSGFSSLFTILDRLVRMELRAALSKIRKAFQFWSSIGTCRSNLDFVAVNAS